MYLIKKGHLLAALLLSILVLTGCSFTTTTKTGTTNSSNVVADQDVFKEALKAFNSTYVPDMRRSDFQFDSQYEGYLNSVKFAQGYAQSMAEANVTKDNAINIIQAISDLPQDLERTQDFSDMKTVFDQFSSYGVDTTKATNIMIDLAEVLVDIALEQDNIPGEVETRLVKLKALLTEDRAAFTTSILTVVNYFTNVYDQFDSSLLTKMNKLVQGTSMTEAEIFILKDEITAVFEDTLPTVDDFKNAYLLNNLILKVAFVKNTIALDDDMINASAVVSHNSSKLFIELIKDFDSVMFNEIATMVSGIYIPGDYAYDTTTGTYVYTPDQYDVRKMVDLVLYFDNYFDQFQLDHKAQFDAISAVQTDELKTKTYNFYKQVMVASVTEFVPNSPEKDMMIEIINNLFDNMDLYEQVNEIYSKYGLDVYDHFISTEGQFVVELSDLVELINDGTDPYTLGDEIQSLLTQYIEYNSIVFGQLTKEELTVIIRYQLQQASFAFLNTAYVNVPNLSDLADTLAPKLADITYSFIQFEISLLDKLEENQVPIEMFLHSENITLEYSTMEQLIKTLDEVLTTEMKTQLTASVESLFDDIFANSQVVEKFQFNIADIAVARTEVLNNLNEFYAYIDLLSTYDFAQP